MFSGGGQNSLSSLTGNWQGLQTCDNDKNVFGLKFGFTLAEVLITLGIIGVVAAMTLPSVIQKHREKVLETGLARFYTTINQAFKASELENGEQQYWEYTDNSCEFYKKYLAKYLKTVRWECGYYNTISHGTSKVNDDRFVGIYLPSGDMAVFSYGRAFTYMVKAQKHYKAYNALMSGGDDQDLYGRKLFPFEIMRTRDNNKRDGVEPFDGLRIYSDEQIRERCIQYPSRCVEMIRRNGWKIPEDYPYKIF